MGIAYAFGTHAGEHGSEEFKESAQVISTSEEFRDLIAARFSLGRDQLGRGSELLAGARPNLRPVA
jgi:hypothetical protein